MVPSYQCYLESLLQIYSHHAIVLHYEEGAHSMRISHHTKCYGLALIATNVTRITEVETDAVLLLLMQRN
jgi:hypothetical protein